MSRPEPNLEQMYEDARGALAFNAMHGVPTGYTLAALIHVAAITSVYHMGQRATAENLRYLADEIEASVQVSGGAE